MLMAECTVLLLPLDVGNSAGAVGCGFWNSNCGGIDMVTVWQVAYCIIAALVVIVFPFFIFYYENDDEGLESREKSEGSCFMAISLRFEAFRRSFFSALCYTALCVALGCIAFFVLQYYIGFTQIPYSLVTVSVSTAAFAPVGSELGIGNAASCALGAPACPCGLPGGCVSSPGILRMDVSLVILLAAILSFAGWFVFSIYVGIGFIALPIDCFNAFIHRPKVLTVSEARTQRKVLMKRSEELIKIGDEMAARVIDAQDAARNKKEKRGAAKVAKVEINRFKLLVDLLEKDLEDFQLGDPQEYRQHYNPLVPYFKLVGGVLGAFMSVLWIIQIIIYMLFNPPLHPFLNQYLGFFDGFFPLFGTLTIGIMGLYLLLAASKGAAKFGTRFFLISVHELEPHKTLLNSFMFNVQLVLLCVLPTVQFCTNAFSQYARNTDAQVIFGSQFTYIYGFRFFWQYNVFLFMILGFTLLSGIYFGIFPSDRTHLNNVMAQIKAEKGKERKAFARKLEQQGGALSLV
jgi:LMBR1 domain-containing protein 1